MSGYTVREDQPQGINTFLVDWTCNDNDGCRRGGAMGNIKGMF